VAIPERLASTTAGLIASICRHRRVFDFCLFTAAALEKTLVGSRLTRAMREMQQPPAGSYADWVVRFDTLSPTDRAEIARHIHRFSSRPTFSILLPVDSAAAGPLAASIDSVRQQLYSDWELCISLPTAAGQSQSMRSMVAAATAADPRIKVVEAVSAGDDTAADANAALALATGDFAGMIAAGSRLAEQALYEMAAEIIAHPDANILYSDEDHLDPVGHRCQPILKTGWNPEMMLSHNMVGHLALFRRRLLNDIGGFQAGLGWSCDYDLVLRASEATPATLIRHLPLVLHHSTRCTTAGGTENESHASALRVVNEHLSRSGQHRARSAPLAGVPGWLEISRTLPSPPPLVSVVIPTRDRADLLEQCLTGLLTATNYPALEVIVADNGSCEPATFRLFDRLATDPRVRILPCPGPFNLSAINNQAVAESRGEILLLLSNSMLIRHLDWLSAMVAQAVRPEVGAVGAKLLCKNGTIQNAGLILGMGSIEPVAGHAYAGTPADSPGYLNHLRIARNVSAVTAACMVMRRGVFDEVGGFDAQHLPVALNDVDLCLKVGTLGYQIIWTPQAELTHLESLPCGSDVAFEAGEQFALASVHIRRIWGTQVESDRLYGPTFDQLRGDSSLAFPPGRKKTWQAGEGVGQRAALCGSLPVGQLSGNRDRTAATQALKRSQLRSTVLANAMVRKPVPRILWDWDTEAIVDRERKFVLLFSAKAACTSVMIWLYHTLGLADEARAYSEWPHAYRVDCLQHPDARFDPRVMSLQGYTLLQIVREPFGRAASSFRHALSTGYSDQMIQTRLGVDVRRDGLCFQQFLDFLAKENLRFCDVHHRRQSLLVANTKKADAIINISRQDLFQELNAFEILMQMPPTDFEKLTWIHHVQAERGFPAAIDMGANADERVLTGQQAQRGPWPQGLLTTRARRRIQRLYADDVARYS